MSFPFVHDPVKDKPSITLLFFYVTFIIVSIITTLSSSMMLIKGQYLEATFMPLFLWILGFVFYRLRKLDNIKINLQERSLELDSGEEGASESKD